MEDEVETEIMYGCVVFYFRRQVCLKPEYWNGHSHSSETWNREAGRDVAFCVSNILRASRNPYRKRVGTKNPSFAQTHNPKSWILLPLVNSWIIVMV